MVYVVGKPGNDGVLDDRWAFAGFCWHVNPRNIDMSIDSPHPNNGQLGGNTKPEMLSYVL